MITTTYTCDSCGHQQDNPKQMWNVRVVIGENITPTRSCLWCRNCMVKNHLLGTYVADDEKVRATAPEEPTFEELIRRIVREEMGGE